MHLETAGTVPINYSSRGKRQYSKHWMTYLTHAYARLALCAFVHIPGNSRRKWLRVGGVFYVPVKEDDNHSCFTVVEAG